MRNLINKIIPIVWHDICIRSINMFDNQINILFDYGSCEGYDDICLTIITELKDSSRAINIHSFRRFKKIKCYLNELLPIRDYNGLQGSVYFSSEDNNTIFFQLYSTSRSLNYEIKIHGIIDVEILGRDKRCYNYYSNFKVAYKLFDYRYNNSVLSKIQFKMNRIILEFNSGINYLAEYVKQTNPMKIEFYINNDSQSKINDFIRILKIGKRVHHYMDSNEIREELKKECIIVENIFYSNIDTETIFIKGKNSHGYFDIKILSCIDIKMIFLDSQIS